MNKIKLINCYFGEFPWYFNFFLKTCAFNPTIDFIIFSDNMYKDILPKNVNIIPFTLFDFNQLSTNKLGFKINVKNPYKLCDFKPAYGLIFSDYIKNYDFWGICDIDVILGRIREFFPDMMLANYDVLSVRNEYPSGFFMLFRNTSYVNSLFTKSQNYKKIFTDNKHYCFDECNFKHEYLCNEGDILEIECEIESMHHILLQEQKKNKINIFYDFMVVEGIPGNLKWENGVLIYKDEYEALLYHLISYKSNIYTKKPLWNSIPNIFYIDSNILRKHSTYTIKGWIKYLYYEKWYPLKIKISYKFDFVISAIFGINDVKNINKGKYQLGDWIIYICQNEDNTYQLSFNESQFNYKLIDSVFNKNTFYLQNLPYDKFKLINAERDFPRSILRIQRNGNVSKYDLINE